MEKMQIDKRDLLTLTVLSLVFFSIATWNLGRTQTPVTTWQSTDTKKFYVDLGRFENVKSVYFLVKVGSANIRVYTGSPENWTYVETFEIKSSYYRWKSFNINNGTQYLRFDFRQYSIELVELAVLNLDYQLIEIDDVVGETASDPNLFKLIDEQELVQCPPTYMVDSYFDEVYYVRTAETYLNLQRPYSWSHPPLGKLILTSGIALFGYNPFGWRLMGVIFATLLIPVIYVVGKELFGTWIGAFASAFLLTFDFMNFTMGRMATADMYVAFFSLTSQLFFLLYIKNVLKNGWKTSTVPLFLAVLFFAFGFSTKWTVLFGFSGQLAMLLALRLRDVVKLKDGLSSKIKLFFSRPFFAVLCFVGVAVCIYFLAFVPSMLTGRSLTDVFDLQWSMLSYHSKLVSTHPFASDWWTWPLILKPIWLAVSRLPNNMVSTIVAMGNPAVWWTGFMFVILNVEHALKRRNFPSIFLSVLFFFQWLPFALISRTTYLYHFYSCVPLLCLTTAYFVNKCWNTKHGKIITLAYFALVVVLFVLFYPAISGMPASTSWINSLKWLKSWVF
jgi:dolichyl-phosphate-mannose-protein mannosyltransferase